MSNPKIEWPDTLTDDVFGMNIHHRVAQAAVSIVRAIESEYVDEPRPSMFTHEEWIAHRVAMFLAFNPAACADHRRALGIYVAALRILNDGDGEPG